MQQNKRRRWIVLAVVVRTVNTMCKEEKHEDSFKEVNLAVNERVKRRGFGGHISHFSYDEENVVTITTVG